MTSIKFRALTHNDHKLFFEALGEHGKDFQNIQQYMAQKCAKSNNKKEEDKKKEQIRNFYNKLYTKLSQLVEKLDDRVEKVNQELYLLINYGEIWKKHGFKFNNKTKKLLEELVHQGYTTLRFKNKNVRLRTPPCKALKKINEIGVDEKVKVVTTRELPKDVMVEFHPKTNRDWLKVQSMAQNPLVRARLSIQKRLFNILDFLENKWNISQDKLNKTVDAWLKVPPNNQQSVEDLQLQQQQALPNNISNGCANITDTFNNNNANIRSTSCEHNQSTSNNEMHLRLRLRPHAKHELKEVNITRVVPDNHLDLSLNAYIKRFGESKVKDCEQHSTKASNTNVSTTLNPSQNVSEEGSAVSGIQMLSNSNLPISLTTPDSSILLERSSTSDQPSIAQVRKHLNILQSLAGSFEGCENSRTACEDTQDRTLLVPPNTETSRSSLNNRIVSFADVNSNNPSSSTFKSNCIPALFDEDAAIETNLPNAVHNSDSQNSKSVDFQIPENLTIGDWIKMTGHHGGGDDANDAFPINQSNDNTENIVETCNKEDSIELCKTKVEPANGPHNHMIDVKKLADGWTKHDESSMTIGELYLAFKCPEKIVLEYEFEQFKCTPDSITVIPDTPSNTSFIFKLLTAASLSLAHLECQKQEQQFKLNELTGAKLKRRKGPSNPNTIKYLKRDDTLSTNNLQKGPLGTHEQEGNDKNQGQGQTMTLLDIETTNQRVEEALKQLQPTRLSVFRRAR